MRRNFCRRLFLQLTTLAFFALLSHLTITFEIPAQTIQLSSKLNLAIPETFVDFALVTPAHAVVDVSSVIINRINDYRLAEGVKNWRLVQDDKLMDAAMFHAHNYPFGYDPHTDIEGRGIKERLADFGTRGTEVVFWTTKEGNASLESAIGWWDDSPVHHRELHRSDLRKIGVGAMQHYYLNARKLKPARTVYVANMSP